MKITKEHIGWACKVLSSALDKLGDALLRGKSRKR